MKLFRSKKIEENHNTVKQFDYKKNNISLAFSLRVDIKRDLETFKELLLKAIEDINKELE